MIGLFNKKIESETTRTERPARKGITAPAATGIPDATSVRDLSPRLNYGIENYVPRSYGLSGGWTYGGAANAGLERPQILEGGMRG